MPPILPRLGSPRPSRATICCALGGEALRFGAEAYGQWWTITSRSWGCEVERLVRGVNDIRAAGGDYCGAWPAAT